MQKGVSSSAETVAPDFGHAELSSQSSECSDHMNRSRECTALQESRPGMLGLDEHAQDVAGMEQLKANLPLVFCLT